jgi:hypothetical protein
MQPTDGSGSVNTRDCDTGALDPMNTGSSDMISYIKNNGWDVVLTPTGYEFENPNHASSRAGYTIIQDFIETYVNVMDDNGIKWWLEITPVSSDYDNFTYQTTASTYESAAGPFLTNIENNHSTNFQGYMFELAYEAFVEWLGARTSFTVSNKDFTGFADTTMMDTAATNCLKLPNGSLASIQRRCSYLDEVMVEMLWGGMTEDWITGLPVVLGYYPNMNITLNVDEVCRTNTWNDAPLQGFQVEGTTDTDWWYDSAVADSCWAERQCALQRCHQIYEVLVGLTGAPFKGMCYDFGAPVWPDMGMGSPDISYFLEFVDNFGFTQLAQTVNTSVTLA